MPKYFTIDRIKQAIQALSNFSSTWVLVPLVFAVNGIDTTSETNPNAEGKAGTDRFLERHFSGSLIGLPQVGNNSLRPKFSDVTTKNDDLVAHQAVKLWGSHYSSRGYREMQQKGLLTVDAGKYRLKDSFWDAWAAALPDAFRFEELLVWLYAFIGIEDAINSWDSLATDFQERYLGPGNRFPAGYARRFRIAGDVPWPPNFLTERPSNETFQHELMPSRPPTEAVVAVGTDDVEGLVGRFEKAVSDSGISFGSNHSTVVRNFLVSVLTKPFVILSGLSGSGKTQIAKTFGEWLGTDRFLLVAVRPDWTGADALFGYENLLDVETNRQWVVPETLKFFLKAASDEKFPYVLVLDEMNLAHVERYFGDFLSGMESRAPVIPNLASDGKGAWRLKQGAPSRINVPRNLIVIGTINVDETTYMFSPKVLDRATMLEFRVGSEDLKSTYTPIKTCAGADDATLKALVGVMTDDLWQQAHPGEQSPIVAMRLRQVHQILAEGGFEFGHRTFQVSIRFTTLFEAGGGESWKDALDVLIYQRLLPRVHGSQRTVGDIIRSLGHYCVNLPEDAGVSIAQSSSFAFDPPAEAPELPLSYRKLRRMYERLRAYQFTTFTD